VRISNVILRVADMDASVAFYRDGLGLKPRFVSHEFSGFETGAAVLMLNRPAASEPVPSAGLAALTEVVLEADDVRAAYAALRQRGVEFRVELRKVTSDGTRDLLAADFRDPDGHVLSLTGWV
jgi:catechol 2,3-dioxygenase-like lactoylglutathione lyase family enzyme